MDWNECENGGGVGKGKPISLGHSIISGQGLADGLFKCDFFVAEACEDSRAVKAVDADGIISLEDVVVPDDVKHALKLTFVQTWRNYCLPQMLEDVLREAVR